MTRDLRSEIHGWLDEHGPATAAEVAAGIRARRVKVVALMPGVGRVVSRPAGAHPRCVYYAAERGFVPSPAVPRVPTHEEKLLAILADHQPHSYRELYAVGCIAHSRVAVLRKRGHAISCWRDGNDYLYQLLRPLDETGAHSAPVGAATSAVAASVSSSAPKVSGERAVLASQPSEMTEVGGSRDRRYVAGLITPARLAEVQLLPPENQTETAA